MTWHQGLTIVTLTGMVLALIRGYAGADTIMVGAVFILVAFGVLKPDDALSGFANPTLWAIAALFAVAAGLQRTGALNRLTPVLFGHAGADRAAPGRMLVSLAAISSVVYNAPLVAIFLSGTVDWARRHRIPLSRVLIPLSYAVLLGGTCTLLGTSTNLVVSALMVQNHLRPLGLLTQTPAGVPVAIVGLLYLRWVAPRLLPDRAEARQHFEESRREYLIAMEVAPGPLVSQSVEGAGLRHLSGVFLVQIDRGGASIAPVAPDERLQAGDHLLFAGDVASVVDLHSIPGLRPPHDGDASSVAGKQWMRNLCEAVVAPASSLVGVSIRDADFRTVFDAAVVAVHRSGERLRGKLGSVVLRSGDTLLLKTGPHFARAHRNDPDFCLVSEYQEASLPHAERAWIALVIAALMIISAAAGVTTMLVAAVGAVGAMVLTRCLTGNLARGAIDWRVVLVMGASLALSRALVNTGIASAAAQALVHSGGLVHSIGSSAHSAIGTLAALYVATNLLGEVIGNTAAPALLAPVGIAAARQIGVPAEPFMVAVALAPSLAFISPAGNHTHLLVYGAGGYQFRDFSRVGAPLNILAGLTAIVSIAIWWHL